VSGRHGEGPGAESVLFGQGAGRDEDAVCAVGGVDLLCEALGGAGDCCQATTTCWEPQLGAADWYKRAARSR
jgi:hypothetical protein